MKFDLFSERPLNELRRKIGLLRDLKNGFELLDGAYVFHATDPERFRALLQEPSARRSAQVLFYDQQIDRVWLNEGVLWCGYRGKEMPEVGEVHQLLSAFAARGVATATVADLLRSAFRGAHECPR